MKTSEILAELEAENVSDRETKSLYLSRSIIEETKRIFPKVPFSRLIERVLKNLIEEHKKAAS